MLTTSNHSPTIVLFLMKKWLFELLKSLFHSIFNQIAYKLKNKDLKPFEQSFRRLFHQEMNTGCIRSDITYRDVNGFMLV